MSSENNEASELGKAIEATRAEAAATIDAEKKQRPPQCDPAAVGIIITEHFKKIRELRKRPLFVLVSDFIEHEIYEKIYSWKKEFAEITNSNVDILIHSPGGDLHSCYTVARLFCRWTDSWEALVPSQAASGATLISLGSSKIILSEIGRLSPLDPQVLSKRPEKFLAIERQSPLEAFQAVKYLREFSLTTLDATMQFLLEHMIAPQPALEAASQLSAQLVQPIMEKIEPYDLGAFALDSNTATEYCLRICQPGNPLKKTQRNVEYASLVEKYPTHDFVIDFEEAKALRFNVCEPIQELELLFDDLRTLLEKLTFYVGLIP